MFSLKLMLGCENTDDEGGQVGREVQVGEGGVTEVGV